MPTPVARGELPRPGADANAKRAAKVANLIVEDLMALGWPVGHVLGSEADLLERYRVSRAVFREAVRLLEHEQVARTRRGPGGGLVVTEPTVGAVVDAVVLYLHRVDARLGEIFEARVVLEQLACQLAVSRMGKADEARLTSCAAAAPVDPKDDPRALHALIASISGNAGLELFVRVFNRVSQLYSPGWERLGPTVTNEAARAHARIADALIARDVARARRRMQTHLSAEAELLNSRRSTRRLLPDSVVMAESRQEKGAEAVARDITRTIITGGLRPGDLVGTEPQLIEREGVSRALLREAVRLLEHHQVARMRRGPGGGLFVVAPSAHAVTEVAAIYLARRGMKLPELAELRMGVELATTELAAARVDEEGAAALHEALAREETASDGECAGAVHDVHAAVARVARNRALHLVALVLIRLSRLHQMERLAPAVQREIRFEFASAHSGIAGAIVAGDAASAREGMHRHLEALSALMR
jgi:DNA-binding FadR family transcriptional regulator